MCSEGTCTLQPQVSMLLLLVDQPVKTDDTKVSYMLQRWMQAANINRQERKINSLPDLRSSQPSALP